MRRMTVILVAIAACAVCARAQVVVRAPAEGGAGAAGEVLRVGAGVVSGELENGLRYVVVEHRAGRGAVWLHVGAGSMREPEGQRGVAAVVQRLVLATPAHFEPGEVERLFTPTAVVTGRPEHATTSYHRAVFTLGLGGRGAGVDEALIFCADALGQAAWGPERVARERDGVLEMSRLMDRTAVRVQEKLLAEVAAGSSLVGAWPGGEPGDLEALGADEVRAFWERWYTPRNAAVVVVTDEPAAAVVGRIERTLGGMRNRGGGAWEARAPAPTAGRSVVVIQEPGLTHASAALLRMEPARGPVRTAGQLDEAVLDAALSAAVRGGLERATREGGLAAVRVEADAKDLFGLVRTVHAGADGAAGDELALVRGVRREIGRAGLDEVERRAAWREVIDGYESIARAPDASVLASWYADRVAAGDAAYPPERAAESVRRLEREIVGEDFAGHALRLFGGGDVVLVVESPAGVSTEDVLAADADAVREIVTAMVEGAGGAVLADGGPGGAVVEMTRHGGTGVTGAWISGGVRVVHRRMDEVPGRVRVRVAFTGGVLEESAADRGVTAATVHALKSPATGTAGSGALARAMSERGVRIDAEASGDAVQVLIDAPADELGWALGVVRAIVADPVAEAGAVERWRETYVLMRASHGRDAYRSLGDEARRAWYPEGEARFWPLTVEQAEAIDTQRVQAWVERLTAGPMAVAIVGDVAWDEALEVAAARLGGMSERDRIGPGVVEGLRRVAGPRGAVRREVTLREAAGAGAVAWGFGGPGGDEIGRVRVLVGAGEILSERIKERVVGAPDGDDGGALAAWANYRLDDTLDAYARFEVVMVAEPERLDGLVERAEAIANRLGADGPTEAEIAMFRERVSVYLDTTLSDPEAWARRLSLLDLRGRSLDDLVTMRDQYMAIDARAIRDEVRSAMGSGARYTAIVRPGEGEHEGE